MEAHSEATANAGVKVVTTDRADLISAIAQYRARKPGFAVIVRMYAKIFYKGGCVGREVVPRAAVFVNFVGV